MKVPREQPTSQRDGLRIPLSFWESQADNQVADCLPQARPAHPPGHVSPLPGDQTAMPAHQRIGGDERGDRVERLSPEELGLRCQSDDADRQSAGASGHQAAL